MQLIFGSGAHWVVPNISNPTPVRMGVAQTMSVDFSQATKPLYGLNRLPVAVGAGEMTVKGKTTLAQLTGRLASDIVFGESLNTGQVLAAIDEAATVAGTVVVANSAGWTTDLGVRYASGANAGVPFVRVASAPAAGQYSVSAGTYTFAVGDAGTAVKISYKYTATGGDTVTLTNQPMGQANQFTSVMALPFAGKQSTLTLNACVVTKHSLATQLSDFTKPDFEFDAYTDASDNLGTWSFADVS